jgi:hypothetical protein
MRHTCVLVETAMGPSVTRTAEAIDHDPRWRAFAVASHVFFIFAFGPLTLLLVVLRPAAFVVFAAGLWLAVSPWLLGYATNRSAWLSELVTGALLSIIGARAAAFSTLVQVHGKNRQPAFTFRAAEAAGSRS